MNALTTKTSGRRSFLKGLGAIGATFCADDARSSSAKRQDQLQAVRLARQSAACHIRQRGGPNSASEPGDESAKIGNIEMERTAKDHHFVPQCYLAGFTDTGTKDGLLCVFDHVASRSFRQKPRNVAFEVDFNRFEAESQHPDALEKAFGKFEGKAASVIRAICRDGELPSDEEFS
jgi:Protein of unknown function (DUF4238)